MAGAKWKVRLLSGLVVALVCMGAGTEKSSAGYDSNYAYNNLLKSRDGLQGQKAELERARNDVLGAIDKLNQRLSRIDSYLGQVDDSLRDVNRALANMH
jgi:hypothetical protein